MVSIRLSELELTNFKNVSYGKISFLSNEPISKISHSDITGIYGQNGSGKTAAINALELLKKCFTGEKLNNNDVYCINTKEEECICKYSFLVTEAERSPIRIVYEFTLKKRVIDENHTVPYFASEKIQYKKLESDSIIVSLLSYSYKKNDVLFSPSEQLAEFVNKQNRDDFLYYKRYSYENSQSFFFSKEFLSLIKNKESKKPVFSVLQMMHRYGFEKLFVITNSHTGIISLNLGIPLAFSHEQYGRKSFGKIFMAEQSKLPLETFKLAENVLLSLNGLLNAIVPDLSLKVEEHGIKTENNIEMVNFELFSIRGNSKIPLRYESEGIRKIISVLDLLVYMYNQDDITVVIDELDAGIFEYLLGELISILRDNGKGQLIFTSHNLRPLEVLDYKSIYFTTTNKNNKYIQFKSIRDWSNLRDNFIRAITLGGQSEPLYVMTNKADIRRAFRSVGKVKE